MKLMAHVESKEETKYLDLIENALREFKEIQKELRRQQIKTERLRASSRRRISETWETLSRVEATL
jgi:5'-deoxynucleotidase YfbR-like HD superfamily hydrolase